jgi:ABC-type transporter Mla MlaB component
MNSQSKASISVLDNNQIELQGILNFESVPILMKQAVILLQKLNNGSDDVVVSFNGVTDSNSAGLALLLEIKRYMQTKNKAITFTDLPEQISTIAYAYGINAELASFLNLQDFSVV